MERATRPDEIKQVKSLADIKAVATETPDGACWARGYAQALRDCRFISAEGLERYDEVICSASAEREDAAADDSLADSLDMAAFDMSARSIAASNMLSALAEAARRGKIAAFEREWLAREAGGEAEG